MGSKIIEIFNKIAYNVLSALLGCRSPCLFNNVLIFIW